MAEKYDHHEVGIPARRRGQQVGDRRSALTPERAPDEWEETPAISGIRPLESDFFADASSQHFGGDASTPDHNMPSTPAAAPSGQPLGQSGGEQEFKQREGK